MPAVEPPTPIKCSTPGVKASLALIPDLAVGDTLSQDPTFVQATNEDGDPISGIDCDTIARNSSTLTYNGETIAVNRAFTFSLNVESDVEKRRAYVWFSYVSTLGDEQYIKKLVEVVDALTVDEDE